MTKLEKELRRREERRINSINKAESDLAEDALRVLWNVVLIMIGGRRNRLDTATG